MIQFSFFLFKKQKWLKFKANLVNNLYPTTQWWRFILSSQNPRNPPQNSSIHSMFLHRNTDPPFSSSSAMSCCCRKWSFWICDCECPSKEHMRTRVVAAILKCMGSAFAEKVLDEHGYSKRIYLPNMCTHFSHLPYNFTNDMYVDSPSFS